MSSELRDTALAMAGAVGAVRRTMEAPAVRELLERAYERGGMDGLMAELDERLKVTQDAYIEIVSKADPVGNQR